MNQIITINFRDSLPPGYQEINVTSRGHDKYRHLSPFMKTNIHCYGDKYSVNVENAWQFSKAYAEHISDDGLPNEDWYKWRDKGFQDPIAHRYPMGKGAIPLYSFWDGIKYNYIEARKNIYFPLYIRSIQDHPIIGLLRTKVKKGNLIAIRDFDVYRFDKLGMTIEDVINNPDKKAGHGFGVYKLLTENY